MTKWLVPLLFLDDFLHRLRTLLERTVSNEVRGVWSSQISALRGCWERWELFKHLKTVNRFLAETFENSITEICAEEIRTRLADISRCVTLSKHPVLLGVEE